MARKTKTNKPLIKSNNNIINNLKLITNLLKGVHFDTYSSDYLSNSDSDKTRKSIDTSLDKLINTAYAQNTVSNLSKLYDQQSALDTNNIGLNMFEDPILSTNLVTTWMSQRWIQDQEDDINLVLKYMPKLKEAMTCKKDLVLSADHFSKDFCSFHKYNSDDTDGSLFARRIDEIKRVYNLAENFELWYEKAQNYGECFIYIAPYSEAFSKLLKNKSNTRFRGFNESTTLLEFNQDYIENNIINESELETVQKAFDEVGINSLTINFNEGLLLSEAKKLDAVRESGILKQESLYESFIAFQESTSIQEDSKYKLDKKLIPDDLEFDDKEDERYSSDGLVNLKQKAEDDVKIKVPGCIVKELERKNVIPLYIGDTCLGYYYIEIKTSELGVLDDPNAYNMSAGMVGLAQGGTGRLTTRPTVNQVQQTSMNTVLNYLSSQIVSKIDKNFIENNQELRKEIYLILKHNDMFNSPLAGNINGCINITFLNPKDVIHMKFNIDQQTHRGISDLAYALFPAKLYSCMYITETIAYLTRGQDKRVYYVKQNVENNISQTMSNVLLQIKKGNFGAREIENLNKILSITGQYNDLVIPLSQNGDAPVQIENMPGQQFTDNSEFLTRLEKMAIDATDLPYDLIEARQSLDYAIQATMTNSKVMRNTFKRQGFMEIFGSEIGTRIYNYEYNENEKVEMSLPAPAFLNMNNGSQLITSTQEYIEKIIENNFNNESDEFKDEYRKRAFRFFLPSHVDIRKIDELAEQSRIAIANRRPQSEE